MRSVLPTLALSTCMHSKLFTPVPLAMLIRSFIGLKQGSVWLLCQGVQGAQGAEPHTQALPSSGLLAILMCELGFVPLGYGLQGYPVGN